jgi:hypothetical protein
MVLSLTVSIDVLESKVNILVGEAASVMVGDIFVDEIAMQTEGGKERLREGR